MSLEEIEYGSEASSELLNHNFEYLDTRISTARTDLTASIGSVNSRVTTLSNTVNNISSTANGAFSKTGNNTLSGNNLYTGRNEFRGLTLVNNSLNDSRTNYAVLSLASEGISLGSQVNDMRYIKLSNGLLIQWGRGYHSEGRQQKIITLPKAYTSSDTYQVFATGFNVTYDGDVSYGNVGAKVSTSSKIIISNERSQNYNAYFNWLTIGH